MQKWEYHQEMLKRKAKGFRITARDASVSLNQLGEAGWELVSILPIASDRYRTGITTEIMYTFKRSIE
jgi:hypothetical protein